MQRRKFIKKALYGLGFILTPQWLMAARKQNIFEHSENLFQTQENSNSGPLKLNTDFKETQKSHNAIQPMQKVNRDQLSSFEFNGDDINKSHEILWNIEGYIKSQGGIPTFSEEADIVIVGGGMSGLLSAYFLKNQKVILLEQSFNLGGNSRGESGVFSNIEGANTSTDYSIGAAYITQPDEGSETDLLLHELGLRSKVRVEKSEEALIYFQKKMQPHFWSGETAPEAQKQFIEIFTTLQNIYNNKYPDIPYEGESQISETELHALDRLSFLDWLQQNFGQVHPHILEFFQLYAWSSFGASLDELSAAQMLNFISAETAEVWALPGGNSAITQALCEKIWRDHSSHVQLRAQATVLDVRSIGDFVEICYAQEDGSLKTLRARHCIMATPKFVARRVLPQMPAPQVRACEQIQYRGYIVANVFIDGPFQSPCFDLYCLKGEMPPSPTAMHPPQRPFTDICFGSWAQKDQTGLGVLTAYKALPYQGARQFLFADHAHNKHREIIMNGLEELLLNLGVSKDRIKGIRMTRWGHSMPVASRGLLASGILDLASQPLFDQIYFVNQDNCANPSFETAMCYAQRISKKILLFYS